MPVCKTENRTLYQREVSEVDNNLKAVCAAPDGVHLSAGNGYGAWVNYLRSHTRYAADSPWTPGSAYAQ